MSETRALLEGVIKIFLEAISSMSANADIAHSKYFENSDVK